MFILQCKCLGYSWVTSRRRSRLLFMGILSSADYETRKVVNLEPDPSGLQTSTGGVEHNGWKGPKTDQPRVEYAPATGPAVDMANEILTQPQAETESAATSPSGHELDAFLGKAFEEKPVWTTLYENIRDVFFPVKLPPLQLTSTPIPVPDRMAVKANPWAIGISTGVNAAILAVVLFFVGRQIIKQINKPKELSTDV